MYSVCATQYSMNYEELDWLTVESEQGDNNQSSQWSIVRRVDGVRTRAEVLLRARTTGAQ